MPSDDVKQKSPPTRSIYHTANTDPLSQVLFYLLPRIEKMKRIRLCLAFLCLFEWARAFVLPSSHVSSTCFDIRQPSSSRVLLLFSLPRTKKRVTSQNQRNPKRSTIEPNSKSKQQSEKERKKQQVAKAAAELRRDKQQTKRRRRRQGREFIGHVGSLQGWQEISKDD